MYLYYLYIYSKQLLYYEKNKKFYLKSSIPYL